MRYFKNNNMPDRIITTGEVEMHVNFDTQADDFEDILRKEAAKLINLIDKAALPRNDLTEAQRQEWNRIRAVAITNIQLGTLAAIEAENI
jgi:hypothetical protein